VIARRQMELAVAVAVGALGAVVAGSAATHHIGWNELGPQPGYFPFRLGVLLMLTAALLVYQAVRARSTAGFVDREQFRRVLSVFLPTAALAAAIPFLGCYVPMAIYLAAMMHWHGNFSWLRTLVTSLAITVAFYLIFELWFLVPLAKGPIEEALGIY
jgi:putative tricarboxylic transport membrane protein